jgi:branched-chain amino acid transport system substrate-binding protein
MLAAWAGAAGPVGSGTASATKSVCGKGTGKKATGSPIKLGGIAMLIPGVDFTTIGKVAKAYYDCVNDNGGINGHRIKYTLYTEALDPNQEKALAKKLIESDKVVGIVGNTSFAECGTNAAYYKSKGFVVIGAGVQAECFSSASFAESNMGPRYSNIGAAQALIRAGVKKIAVASPDTISAYADGGVVELGKQKGVEVKVFPTHLPVTDATSQLIQMYQFAGDGNGILLDFTPDTAPAFMKAAEAQGIVAKVKWGSSTPIANTFMSGQFSPAFDGHLWINSEFGLIDPKVGPDTALMFQILKKYAPSIAPQAFGQMGFMDAKFSTAALLSIKGAVTAKSYNNAVRALKNIKTDMLCKPWYVGNLAYHIPNNTDITVDYKGGQVVSKEKCFDIAPVDASLTQTRAWEKKYNLNTGK